MTLDVNVDFRDGPSHPGIDVARRHGVTYVRCSSLPEMEDQASRYLDAGIRVLGIYTGESDNAGKYVMQNISALQIGNEFGMGGDASWPLGSPDDMINVWNHVTRVLLPSVHPHGLPLVGPGIWMENYSTWA